MGLRRRGIFAAIVFIGLLLSLSSLRAVSAATVGRMGGSSSKGDDDHDHDSFVDDHEYSSTPRRNPFKEHCDRLSPHVSYVNSNCGGNSSHNSTSDDLLHPVAFIIIFIIIFAALAAILYYIHHQPKISILKIQVALSAIARDLPMELNDIASTTDTSRKNGWHTILEETILLLCGYPHHYYLYGSSSATLHEESKYMRRFRQLSKQEGDKCDGESLVNVNGHTMQKPVIPKAGKLDEDCILVTILVAVKGCHKLPAIKTANGVKRALRYLKKISKGETKALEVLWTPQDENDALPVQELREKYPHLTNLWGSW
ncbi:hypothetical protein CCACVL1_23702 [Corchorus capsularis]|uniref:Uncharacterized protein n=1 Tax=Corchorus capsularis TaxID=210143 RepID=A0A1R3GSW7_COCAP|nr:hypothetical protein CCACVL1_23702 [Corchorus capsularis]